MKSSWDPLPSVLSAGFLTVDLSPLKEGELNTVQWRGKPIFIMKKPKGSKPNSKRCLNLGNDEYSVMIGICTHLGCIPAWKEKESKYKCACHGGEFDIDGVNTFGPPPRPFDIPPFKIEGTKLTLGEEGPEYKKLSGKA
jgi:ubiquinol-cytochrome c reductase iron-sulfur subunit